jgi:hypothetical protein
MIRIRKEPPGHTVQRSGRFCKQQVTGSIPVAGSSQLCVALPISPQSL